MVAHGMMAAPGTEFNFKFCRPATNKIVGPADEAVTFLRGFFRRAMTIAYLIAPVLALLLLAAHFYRSGNYVVAVIACLAASLVLVRRPWAAPVIQVCLVLGSVEWLRSTFALVTLRHAAGEPFMRLALILGGVTLFTALAALVFRNGKVRHHFRRP